jgi:acyl-CoA dehydrogenase
MLTTLAILLISLLAAWALAFIGAPLLVWTLVIGLVPVLLFTAELLGPLGLGISLLVWLPPALMLNLRPLRRSVITRPIFTAFKRVLPEMSSTEREALEAGDVWWEGELFSGRPDWQRLKTFQYTTLTDEEQRFLDTECDELCRLCDDWKIEFEDKDLPPEAWQYIRDKGFLAMLIKKEYGGLGFSAVAQSAVVSKLATKSITLAVTVMVPNSLGPGELLMHYGTEAQKQYWLPRLVRGEDIPCFGLTGPEVGSDATAMPDLGVIGYGEHEGQKTLGIRLNFSKRWITLAPVATVIGLAFKLRDPDGLLGDGSQPDLGITCALIPASHPGVRIGRRHYPGAAFHNGPIFGEDVFIPLDWIIGGPQMAGKGWRMLVECLSAGRGISLPALATAAGQASYRMVGAYGRIRRQFKLNIGKFEGVQEATGRIAGLTYTLEATRLLTASAVDHCAPSVVTAIAKYHMTEMMRRVVNDSMDVFSGRGVQQGPRNPLATAYKATPIAITVEGANILTRNLMIFGQGAIRCHPYVFPEMEAARQDDLAAFDKLLFRHIGFSINRAVRALTHGLTGSRLAGSPAPGPMADYARQLERMSASLAFVADMTMGLLGGDLKRKERLSARLGDVLSQLYMGSAVIRYYLEHGESGADAELQHARWALDNALFEIGRAFEGFFDNFPVRGAAGLMRRVVFPLGNPYRPVNDVLNGTVADQLMEPGVLRDRLSALVYRNGPADDPIVRLERCFEALVAVEPVYLRFYKLAAAGELAGQTVTEQLNDAVTHGHLSAGEAEQVRAYDALRYDAILTDDFTKAYMAGDFGDRSAEVVAMTREARVA